MEQVDTPSYLDGDSFGCRGGSNPPLTAKFIFMDDTVLFIYGICLIGVFSMLALDSYQQWLNKNEYFIDFFIFAVIDIITIIAFIAQFTN